MNASLVQTIAIIAIPLIFAITVHEVAHGYVASKLGDKTAEMLGRLSFNPMKHIDLIGTLLVPIVMFVTSGIVFGWAKPVPVAWQNLRHPRRDKILVALAGPFANLLMAFFWAGLLKLSALSFFHADAGIANQFALFTRLVATYGIFINLLLLVLNLIPIPPLDGSRVVSCLLPPRAGILYDSIEPYGLLILVVLLFFGALSPVLMGGTKGLFGWIQQLFAL